MFQISLHIFSNFFLRFMLFAKLLWYCNPSFEQIYTIYLQIPWIIYCTKKVDLHLKLCRCTSGQPVHCCHKYGLCYRCVKAALLPHLNASWETKPSGDLKNPKFAEVFRVAIPEHKLLAKTLQVNLWSQHDIMGEKCLVGTERESMKWTCDVKLKY